jgi:hypothetical protein
MEHCGEMDNITEEQVTKNILKWLKNNDWKIIAYDFPQSGTGKYLHPNKNIRQKETKNHQAFIPDIVAIKNDTAIFFENKNRFFLDDFIKLKEVKNNNNYSISISNLLNKYSISNIYFGIGAIDNELFVKSSKNFIEYVDFIVLISNKLNNIKIYTDIHNIFKE